MENPINKSVFDSRDLIEYEKYFKKSCTILFNDYMLKQDSDYELDFEVDFLDYEDFLGEFPDIHEFYEFFNELNDDSEFESGTAIIHEDYWVEYVQELVEDIGDLPKDLPSYIVIDWENTANNLMDNYRKYDYKDQTYLKKVC